MLKFRICLQLRHDEGFKELISHLPMVFEKHGTILHKGRNCIKMLTASSFVASNVSSFVVKRFHRPNVFQRLDYSFIRKSKARRAWHNAEELQKRDIPTPLNLAYAELRKHGIYQCSYYVSAYDGGTKLSELETGYQDVVSHFATFVASMHKDGVVHRDLNPSNILVRLSEKEGKLRFTLVDINRMKIYNHPATLKESMPDLMTFSTDVDNYRHFVRKYLVSRNMWSKSVEESIVLKKQKRNNRRQPIKKFFKRFDKYYYKLLER